MAVPYKQTFIEGVNLDADELLVKQHQAMFIKNMTANLGPNPSSPSEAGANLGKYKPLEGNTLIPVTLPGGLNYCVGFYSSEQTNEGYAFIYNSTNQHSILVINGDTGAISLVYRGPLLPFALDPEYFFTEGRVVLVLRSYFDKATGKETDFKFLIFANNKTNQFCISVDDSIATNSFSTAYFTASGAFYNPIELIHHGVPTPLNKIGINTPTAYVPAATDVTKQNLIVRSGWQFRVKFIDIYGRETEHGIISEQFISVIGGGCLTASNGLSRCLTLNFDAGNPLVKFIQVEYRKWIGDDRAAALNTGWQIYEVFRKYDDSGAVAWYNRVINPLFTTPGSGITFDALTNLIKYNFCADKNSIPIDPSETSRTEPELPRISAGVFAMNKSIGFFNNVRGFEPVDPLQVNKVKFSPKLPSPNTGCEAAPLRTITFYAVIYSFYTQGGPGGSLSRFIYMNNGKAVWGFGSSGCGSYGPYSMDQVFGDQTPNNSGFIASLRGTSHKCISQQVDFNPSTGTSTFVGYTGSISASCFLQKFTIPNVPAGKYIAQIHSHKAKISDPDLQRTSTYVGGISKISNLAPASFFSLNDYASKPDKEIVIDCTAGDVHYNLSNDPLFVILDMAFTSGGAAMDGYLYEKVGEDVPVEMCPVAFPYVGTAPPGSPLNFFGSFFTDHNGFYFGGYRMIGNMALKVFADMCDGMGTSARQLYGPTGLAYPAHPSAGAINQSDGGIMHGDGTNTPTGACLGVHGDWKGRVYLTDTNGVFPEGARRVINQRVGDCTTNSIGLPGIVLAMTKVGFAITNTSGRATLVAHNRYNFLTAIGAMTPPYLSSTVPDYSTSPNNQDRIIFSQSGGACEWTDCGNCNHNRADVVVAYLACGAPPSGCTVVGQIAASTKGAAGSGYTVGATGTITTGTTLATYQVVSIGAGGSVDTYIIVNDGEGYVVGGPYATTPVTGGGDGAFTVNVTKIKPTLRTTCLADVFVKFSGVNLYGVQSGGRYGCGFVLHDEIGRHTFVQIRQGQEGFIDIPNLNDVNGVYPQMALCGIKCDIDPTTVFPTIFKKMTVCITANVAFTDFMSWAADWVQLIDNSGITNPINPTAIRIYYGSLGEYAKNNNFTTNTGWELIDTGGSAQFKPRAGDIVQFIKNGDNVWFESVIAGPVTYDKSGAFFTIEYIPELAGLMNGSLFRIIRPAQNISGDNVPFYEVNYDIPIVNGIPQILSFTVPYKDSYLIGRQIPVPGLKGQGGALSPGANLTGTPYPIEVTSTNQDATLATDGYSENNINNANGVVIFETRDFATSFPFFFESPSPADTWGSHLADRGRLMFRNATEAQERSGTEVAMSDKLSDRGSLNYLSYFERGNVFTFDRNAWGNILAAFVETGTVLFITDRDNFAVSFGTSNLKADDKGNVIYQNQYGPFSAPDRKVGSNYGCSPKDLNTIKRYSGRVCWLDSTGFVVFHDFKVAQGVSVANYYDSYINQKISKVNQLNLSPNVNGLTYFTGGIDPRTYEYYLSSFNLPVAGSPSYINALSDVDLSVNETLIIDMEKGILKGMAGFTPENYGLIPGHYLQRNFLTFKQGKPYIHHNGFGSVAAHNNFYGTQCKKWIVICVNIGGDKVKRFLWNEVYCKEHKFVATKIITQKGQSSRLLDARWDFREKFWCAEFLCDLLTPPDPNLPLQTGANVLFDGNPLSGSWMKVWYSSLNADDALYCELSSIVNYLIGVEPTAD